MAALAKKYGVRDVLKTYIYSRQYTKEELLPCAAHIVDGKITDTMFDSFIFLPSPCYLYDTSDPELQAEGCHKRMTKADWLSYLTDLQNVPGHNVEALDAAVGETKAALGLTDYKANIFPSILYPTKGTADKFGEVYGKKLDLRDPADRLASIKWMVDEQIRRLRATITRTCDWPASTGSRSMWTSRRTPPCCGSSPIMSGRSVISPSGRRFTAPAASIAGRNATLT